MSSLRYFIVDVFAEEKYAGNQLAVFVDSGDLPDSYKQRIAKETNYSETTADFDLRFPIQQVSTGIPFVIVPLKTLAAVKRARPQWEQYVELTKGTFPRSILVFAKETYAPENDLNVRVFVDEVGVPEDPATGSGNGCLAGYLVNHRYFGKPELDIRVEQGYEIGRPSLLFLRAADKGDRIEVMVGGHVVMVARGEFV